MAKKYWLIKEGQQNVINQLFTDSPGPISVNEEVLACFDKDILYDHTYEKKNQCHIGKITYNPFLLNRNIT